MVTSKKKKCQDVIYILQPQKSNQCDIFTYVDTKQIKKKTELRKFIYPVSAAAVVITPLHLQTVVHGNIQSRMLKWPTGFFCTGDVKVAPFFLSEVLPLHW